MCVCVFGGGGGDQNNDRRVGVREVIDILTANSCGGMAAKVSRSMTDSWEGESRDRSLLCRPAETDRFVPVIILHKSLLVVWCKGVK